MSFRDFSPQRGAEAKANGRKRSPHPQSWGRSETVDSPLRRSASGSNNPAARPVHSPHYQQSDIQFTRSKSDSHDYQKSLNSYASAQQHVVQQREEEYAIQVMQQREEEMRDIHRKMHVVNEIYKDLGEVVDGQQEHIDNVEDQFSGAAEQTRRGLEQIQKANNKGSKTGGGDQEGEGKRKQFFLMRYLTKAANDVAKLASACGGSASASYVNDEDGVGWNEKDR